MYKQAKGCLRLVEGVTGGRRGKKKGKREDAVTCEAGRGSPVSAGVGGRE